jgi:hypothetical protein
MTDFLGTVPVAVAACFTAAVLLVIASIAFRRGFRVSGKNGGTFQLGDDTPFGKTNARFKRLCADTRDLVGKLGRVERDVLSLCFHDEKRPIEERLRAGRSYIEAGGNGAIKAEFEILKEKYKELYAKITVLRTED